jgi:hypothetical protein
MSQTNALPTKVAVLLAQFPGPLSLPQTSRFWIVLFAPMAATIAFLAWVMWNVRADVTIKGLVLIATIVLGVVAPLIVLISICVAKKMPRLVLDADGYEIQQLFYNYRRPWRRVEGFSSFGPFVVVHDHSPPHRHFVNRELIIPGFARLGPYGLTCLLTAWRKLALERGPWGMWTNT